MHEETRPPADTTVLVTGGTGYLASWVIATLLQRGYQVRTTVRDLSRADTVRVAVGEQTPADAITFTQADLTQDRGWEQAVAGADYVLHVASPLSTDRSQDIVRVAREGVRRVLDASARAGVRRVVLTSSGFAAAAGHVDTAPKPDPTGHPRVARPCDIPYRRVGPWRGVRRADG